MTTNTDLLPLAGDAAEAAPTETFEHFGLKETILRGVREAGFSVPSPIQSQAIPLIMAGRDMVGQAHTGTGKTAAFGLPGMNAIKHAGHVEMLVITPTRELATQVADELYRLGQHENIRTLAIYGGQAYGHQLDGLRRGVQVVVATPGRLLDLLEGGRAAQFFKPALVVLDEADEMLDMGFLEDIQKIFMHLPEERQTLLFSATMPQPIQTLAKSILKEPAFISVNPKEATVKEIQQQYCVINEHERDDAIVRLIDSLEPGKAIIFCRTKSEVDRLSTTLLGRGHFARGLHGDMEQPQREETISGFRSGAVGILVATDVAARGLDVADVTHVFNYHIPFDSESYVHRIGRTGRAGKKGMAVTLITPAEYQGLKRIQGHVGRIQWSQIPTRKEMRKALAAKLVESVKEQEINKDAEKVFENLAGEMDLAELACRLIAMQLEQEAVSGPDRIGLDHAAVERMQRPGPPTARGGKGYGGKGFGNKRPYGAGKPYGQNPYGAGRPYAGQGKGGFEGKRDGKWEGKPEGKWRDRGGETSEGKPAGKPEGKWSGKPEGGAPGKWAGKSEGKWAGKREKKFEGKREGQKPGWRKDEPFKKFKKPAKDKA